MEDLLVGAIYKQRCGDTLKILEKTNLKSKYGSYLYKVEFQQYKKEKFADKQSIIRGCVSNPEIERVEFIEKLHPQHCGDTLKVLEKVSEDGVHFKWKCTFINDPYTIVSDKSSIIRGTIANPALEQNFQNKIYKQNCGDELKIISKTSKKDRWGKFFYKCIFLKYPSEVLCLKQHILRGVVENPNLPWKNKEALETYIKNTFLKKITLIQLANNLGVAPITVGRAINKFGLREYIEYNSSSVQIEIENFIKNLGINCFSKTFGANLNFKEIDVFCSKEKLGFEYNGNYWHSDLYKEKDYHQDKILDFLQKENIRIFNIFEYEWENNEEKIKYFIKSKFKIFEKKIFARKCYIKELETKIYQEFCNQNHLQGQIGAKLKIGLYYGEELVQIISFGIPRFTENYDWEIIRECSKLGYLIVGGKEKLWKYFVEKYKPNNCITYCDFSKFDGSSYLKLGFKKERLNKPGFVWYDEKTNEIFWRNPYQHKEMKDKGYNKIYDCGQLVFVWSKQ